MSQNPDFTNHLKKINLIKTKTIIYIYYVTKMNVKLYMNYQVEVGFPITNYKLIMQDEAIESVQNLICVMSHLNLTFLDPLPYTYGSFQHFLSFLNLSPLNGMTCSSLFSRFLHNLILEVIDCPEILSLIHFKINFFNILRDSNLFENNISLQ